jgi:type II secretory pathway pseudopilin PulG
LVIVVVIIGVIAAIAVPRISRGARGAGDAALRANLASLRSVIDLYAAEHNGNFPDVAAFEAQLTTFTDSQGDAVDTKDATHIYGPYLRVIPGLPVNGGGAASDGIKGDNQVAAATASGVGWIYTEVTGTIVANTGTAEDEDTTLYTDY